MAPGTQAPVPAVAKLIQQLGLQRHPEGGYYKETFRDSHEVAGRAASTAILYLLPAGAKSKLHRLDASECWHSYLGGPVTVVELDAASPEGCKTTLLGRDLAAGQQLQHVVAPHAWFGAAPAEGTDWALVGCTVAPGFEFANFEMGEKERLLRDFPRAADWIERLMAD